MINVSSVIVRCDLLACSWLCFFSVHYLSDQDLVLWAFELCNVSRIVFFWLAIQFVWVIHLFNYYYVAGTFIWAQYLTVWFINKNCNVLVVVLQLIMILFSHNAYFSVFTWKMCAAFTAAPDIRCNLLLGLHFLFFLYYFFFFNLFISTTNLCSDWRPFVIVSSMSSSMWLLNLKVLYASAVQHTRLW